MRNPYRPRRPGPSPLLIIAALVFLALALLVWLGGRKVDVPQTRTEIAVQPDGAAR